MRAIFSGRFSALIVALLGLSSWVSGQPLTVELTNYTVCVGGSVSLVPIVTGGQEPYNYTWTPASGLSCADCAQPIAAPAATTTYQLTVSDALGEEAVANSVVSVSPTPIVTLQLSSDCNDPFNNTVFAFATGGAAPYTYQWSTGFIGEVHTGLAPGTYCVTATNTDGCSGQSCINVIQPPSIQVQVATTPASCGSTNDGSLSALNVTGGIPPYTYLWNNGNTAPVTQGLSPGIYTLTITDANGCMAIVSAEVGSELQADAGDALAVLNCLTNDVLLQGSTNATGPNLSYEWTGPSGFIVNTLTATATQPGVYTFKVTDNDQPNCFTTDVIEVVNFESIVISDMNIELLGCNQYRLSGQIPPDYFGPMTFEWTFPDGSTFTGISILPNQTGMYTLAISIPGNPCEEAHVARFIDLEAEACATINGQLVEDADGDCAHDDSEPGLSGWVISATGPNGVFHALTDADGHYSFSLPLGDYEVAYNPPSPLWESCTTPPSASLSSGGQEVVLNLAARAIEPCPELVAGLASPFLRRCFSSYYYVSVFNAGSGEAIAPTATLLLDPLLTYQTSQLPPASINGQELSWTLPDLAPGQYYAFWVQVLVSCDAVLGQTHCSELTLTPNELCRPTEAGWSGASLRVQGECVGDEVRFRVRNSGSGDLIAPVEYIVVEDAVMMMQAPGLLNTLPSGEEALYTFPANGATYVFRIAQAALHPFDEFSPTAIVEGCGENELGQFSTGWSNQFPLDPPSPASLVVCIPNQGAYDPNDKQAFPQGYGENHYIEAGDLIRYRLRFQNTGTDTAFTVVIRDALSPWLDINTLQPGSASHAFRTSIESGRTLVFTFDNIRLPDSTTNLAASQGFVDFAIRVDRNTPLETRIENNAGIYFDFNEPVITNTVFHTVGEDFILVSTWRGPSPEVNWQVYPNPATPYARLQWNQLPEGLKTANLMSADGRLIWRRTFSGMELALDAGLAPGVYFLNLWDAKGSYLGAGKLMIQE
jgi:uncharacterized repeat protein (TIGR01451 family)